MSSPFEPVPLGAGKEAQAGSARLRVVTYNILLGGERRQDLIVDLLKRLDADVVALQEVTDPAFIPILAEKLEMNAVVGEASDGSSLSLAVLSRWPIVSWRNRRHPQRMLRSHLECEIAVDGAQPTVRIHCLHLAARFGESANGETRRMREMSAVLGGIDEAPPGPHLILGDFNALAPGDGVRATLFFRRMAKLRRAGLVVALPDGTVGPRRRAEVEDRLDEAWLAAGIDPRLDVGVPDLPSSIGPLTGSLPVNVALDRLLGRIIDRRTVQRLLDLGYVDCYRQVHPDQPGYTCATWVPAARIDYVFASPDLARALERCEVVGSPGWPDATAAVASDHFPLFADFSM